MNTGMRLLVVVSLLMLLGCVSTPEDAGLSTENLDFSSTPTLYASPEVRECLFDIECSGLFSEGEVQKAPLLQWLTSEESYWIQPNGPDYWQDAIRFRVMPTIEKWTGAQWRERRYVVADDLTILQWFTRKPETDGWAGSATYGSPQITVGHESFSGEPFPEEVIYQVALHEVLHALWYAVHTPSGLMCECEDGERLEIDGVTWGLRTFPDMLNEVYALYAHPLLLSGSKARVEAQIQEKEGWGGQGTPIPPPFPFGSTAP